MEALHDNTKKFLKGQIGVEEYIQILKQIYKQVDIVVTGGGTDTQSFLLSVECGIEYIEDANNGETKLRLKALICNICNDLKNAIDEKQKKNPTKVAANYRNYLCGVKKYMAMDIIKECKVLGNSAYGFAFDKKGEDVFAVDIPTCGQISWHFPGRCGIICKDYPYELEHKDVESTNMTLLCESVNQGKFETLSQHMQTVINSQDIEEMAEGLKGLPKKPVGRLDLSHLVAAPSTEELKIGTKSEPNAKDISAPGE